MNNPETLIDVNRLLAITAQLQTTRHAHHLDALGLTVAQFSVLNHLARQKAPSPISRIANAVEVLQPAVTKMMRKFESSGWVNILPDPNDKRARLIEITPKGHGVIGDFYAIAAPDARACFDGWNEEDLITFRNHLNRVVGWLDQNRLGKD